MLDFAAPILSASPMRSTVLLLALLLSLVGCGKKGALYLPEQASPQPTSQPQP